MIRQLAVAIENHKDWTAEELAALAVRTLLDPGRRIADLPVELDGRVGRSIRAAERDLAGRMVARYKTALANRSSDVGVEGIRVLVMYPEGQVSEVQEAQFTTLGRLALGLLGSLGLALAAKLKSGAAGVKVWKDLGLHLRDDRGDPALDRRQPYSQ